MLNDACAPAMPMTNACLTLGCYNPRYGAPSSAKRRLETHGMSGFPKPVHHQVRRERIPSLQTLTQDAKLAMDLKSTETLRRYQGLPHQNPYSSGS